MRVVYGEFSALLSRDTKAGVEQTLVRKKPLSPAVVPKAKRRGSSTSMASAFPSILRPAIAIISVYAGDSYGDPRASVLTKLKPSGAKVRRTDLDGTISAKTDGES